MGRVLLYVIPLVVTLYALIDCIQTPRAYARTLPKWLWLILVVLVPFVGAVAWLLLGRPSRSDQGATGGGLLHPARRAVPAAPDDDPAFLRKLADDEWTRKMRARRDDSGVDGPA